MPEFCDVALSVPLDTAFTYRIGNGIQPAVGGRVLVPFRQRRMPGVVVELHDREPKVQAKNIISALDSSPVLDDQLLQLGRWIANYYLAPLGEVFRSMLPLAAEFKHSINYRITDEGRLALHQASMSGSSGRSRRTPEEQLAEFRVLDYLSERDMAREVSLRAAARASKTVLEGMVRKRWIAREDLSDARDGARMMKFAILKNVEGRLNANQRTLIDTLAGAGGRISVEALRGLAVPRTTLATLVKRGGVEITEEPAGFTLSGLKARPSQFDFQLNAAQQDALKNVQREIAASTFSGILLHGVTGSGKTAVYLAAMKSVLDAGRSAILLVPEIGLPPAVAADLHQVFGDEVAILHSALSAQERAEQWHRVKRGETRMVVGTRSAVFAPLSDLALIIVDEEQESSYKQEETPRYHARDVAIVRAKSENALALLGSATPSLESYHHARERKYELLTIAARVASRPLPSVEIISLRDEFQQTHKTSPISSALHVGIEQCLSNGTQALILINRRGYSWSVLCRSCGASVQCENCSISMIHHKSRNRLECHYCGSIQQIPKQCPKCQSRYVYFFGEGSEHLEERLRKDFPSARIARLDRDTARTKRQFQETLGAFAGGALDILVGTQMLAKGHDFHRVTLVGVVGPDASLSMPDFRAAERTFQLLTQVAGRAGRGELTGRVLIQTYYPDHYAIQDAVKQDYAAFFERELNFRRMMAYPPFTSLANVIVRDTSLEKTIRWSRQLSEYFSPHDGEGVRILGPATAQPA